MHACKQAQLIHVLSVNHLRLNDFSCMVNVVGNVKNVSQLCSRAELMVAHSYICLSEIILYKKMDNVGPFFPKFGKIDLFLNIGLCHCFVFIDPNYIQETKKTNAPVLGKLRP